MKNNSAVLKYRRVFLLLFQPPKKLATMLWLVLIYLGSFSFNCQESVSWILCYDAILW